MSAAVTLTDQEETNLYRAKKLAELGADMATPASNTEPAVPIDREALAVFFQVIAELLPKK